MAWVYTLIVMFTLNANGAKWLCHPGWHLSNHGLDLFYYGVYCTVAMLNLNMCQVEIPWGWQLWQLASFCRSIQMKCIPQRWIDQGNFLRLQPSFHRFSLILGEERRNNIQLSFVMRLLIFTHWKKTSLAASLTLSLTLLILSNLWR